MKLIDNNLRSFYVKGKLPQWAIWLFAAVLFCIAWYLVSVCARAAALAELKKHTDHWDDSGILNQETSYTCVPASMTMLMKDQGIDTTTYDMAVATGTDIRGTDGGGIVRGGREYGFEVEHIKLGFDEFMERDLPGIVIFSYKKIRHAAYILPMRDVGYIQVKDSIQGLLHFEKDGANDYFESEEWDVYLFKKT